jgi:hypothetical protein
MADRIFTRTFRQIVPSLNRTVKSVRESNVCPGRDSRAVNCVSSTQVIFSRSASMRAIGRDYSRNPSLVRRPKISGTRDHVLDAMVAVGGVGERPRLSIMRIAASCVRS